MTTRYLVAKARVRPRIYAAASRGTLVIRWTLDPTEARRYTYAVALSVANRNRAALHTAAVP